MNRYKLIPTIIITLLITLSGCSQFENAFSSEAQAPLPGKRISILEKYSALTPDAHAAAEAVTLPTAWNNRFWPQTGGYPNHAMGQLELDQDLKLAWNNYVGSYTIRSNPLLAQPIVVRNTVYTLNNQSEVSAYDLVTGERKWEVTILIPDGSSKYNTVGGGIAYAEGKIYITNGYKQLVCINPETGKLNWRATLPSPARSAPTASGDRVYIITLNNNLLTFSAADGELLWSYAGVENSTNLLSSIAPAVNQNIVVLPLSSGEIIGLRPENGQVVWGDNISAIKRTGTIFSIPDIRGQPVIDQGLVIASSYSGRIVAIDEITGKRVWQQPIGSSEMAWSADNTVYVVSNEQKLIALSRKDGGIRWITTLPKTQKKNGRLIWTGPILAGGRLITANNKGSLVEADPLTGKILKHTKIHGKEGVSIAPIVADKTLLLLTDEGGLLAYR